MHGYDEKKKNDEKKSKEKTRKSIPNGLSVVDPIATNADLRPRLTQRVFFLLFPSICLSQGPIVPWLPKRIPDRTAY